MPLKYLDWSNLRPDTQESIARARVLEVARTYLGLEGPDLPMVGQLDALLAELAWNGILFGTAAPLVALAVIDNGSDVIQTGFAGYLAFPEMNLTITGWQLIGTPQGSITLDLWKSAYGAGEPSVADTIITSGKPEIVDGVESRLNAAPDWDLSIAAGDKIGVNVDAINLITKVTLAISLERAAV